MRIHNPTNYLLAAAVFLAVPAIGVARGESDDEAIEEIVVTGTGVARTTFETPQSVVQFSEEDYRQMTFNSQADVLTQLPGVSAEGGGGEVAVGVVEALEVPVRGDRGLEPPGGPGRALATGGRVRPAPLVALYRAGAASRAPDRRLRGDDRRVWRW